MFSSPYVVELRISEKSQSDRIKVKHGLSRRYMTYDKLSKTEAVRLISNSMFFIKNEVSIDGEVFIKLII